MPRNNTFFTLVDGYIVAKATADINLPRPPDLTTTFIKALFPVSEPARNARDRKQDGKKVEWKSHGLVDEAGPKVDIWVEPAIAEERVSQCCVFQCRGDFDQWLAPACLEDRVGYFADDLGSRVCVAVHAVAEPELITRVSIMSTKQL